MKACKLEVNLMKMKIPVILIITALIFISCKEKHENKNSMPVPAFEIKVDLDKRAEREMRERSETIHISLELSGSPRKDSGIKENEIDKARGLVLGFSDKELNEEGVVRFEGLRIPERLYNALEDKDYVVSVGISSGWKSSKFDLLNCEPFDKAISEVTRKQHTIKCKLNLYK